MKRYSLTQVVVCSAASVFATVALGLLLCNTGHHRHVQYALSRLGLAPIPRYYRVNLSDPETARAAQQRYRQIAARRDVELTPAQQTEIMELYHRLGIWENMWWLGVKIQKNPCDLWMMQQILSEVRPDYVIEAGTLFGGSALYFAHVLDGLGLDDSKVITIDIEEQCQEAAKLPLWKEKVEFIHGSSTDPDVVRRIRERVNGKKVVVVLDSDHTRDHVLHELLCYSPMVGRGSYLVAEDTNIDGVPVLPEYGPGPMAAVSDFLQREEGTHFSQDVSREALVLTFNPGGWLKRR